MILHYAILGIGALLAAGWLLYQQWQIWHQDEKPLSDEWIPRSRR